MDDDSYSAMWGTSGVGHPAFGGQAGFGGFGSFGADAAPLAVPPPLASQGPVSSKGVKAAKLLGVSAVLIGIGWFAKGKFGKKK